MMWLQIRNLIVQNAMSAIWLMINLLNLWNFLVLILIRIECSENALSVISAAICNAAAISNSVTVAQFFNHVCKIFFDDFIQFDTEQIDIFEQVANHYDVVETNNQEMLHLHVLIWLAENLEFNNLWDWFLQDDVFAHKMICYFKSIIVQNINFNIDNIISSANTLFSFKDQDLNHEFHERLAVNSNIIVIKTQIHSFNHTTTCFKYCQKNAEKNACRFNMLQEFCL